MAFIKSLLLAFAAAVPALAGDYPIINVYWGQNGVGDRLVDYCRSPGVDMVTLAFVNVSPENAGNSSYPGTNFAAHCSAAVFEKNGVPTELLSGCYQIMEDIPKCQALGKKVLLSIGGVYSTTSLYSISTPENGRAFGEFMWNAFGPYEEGWDGPRPFDLPGSHVSVDGFDFDIEFKFADQTPWIAMVGYLRNRIQSSGLDMILTAAPQCRLDDPLIQMKDLMEASQFDRFFIQFYNNIDCPSLDEWFDFIKTTPSVDAKLHIGLLASPGAGGSGYLESDDAIAWLCQYVNKDYFGGVSLWDGYFGSQNVVDNETYYGRLLDGLIECGPARPKPTTTSATTMSSTSSTSVPTSPTPTTTEKTSTTETSATESYSSTSTSSNTPSTTSSSMTNTESTANATTTATTGTTTTGTTTTGTTTTDTTTTESTTTEATTNATTTKATTTEATTTEATTTEATTTEATTTGATTTEVTATETTNTESTTGASTTETTNTESTTKATTTGATTTGATTTEATTTEATTTEATTTGATTTEATATETTNTESTTGATTTGATTTGATTTEATTNATTTEATTTGATTTETTTTSATTTEATTTGATTTEATTTEATTTESTTDATTTKATTTKVTTEATTTQDTTKASVTTEPNTTTTVNETTVEHSTTSTSTSETTATVSPIQVSPTSSGIVSSMSVSAGSPTVTIPSLTTSTVRTTTMYTITSCAPTVTNCPVGSVTTSVIDLYTTVCPVASTTTLSPSSSQSHSHHQSHSASIPPESMTTSTLYTTTVYTVTSCPPSVPSASCPAHVGSVTTEVVAIATTVCPISAASFHSSTSATASPSASKSGTSSNGAESGIEAVQEVPTSILGFGEGSAAAVSTLMRQTTVVTHSPLPTGSTGAAANSTSSTTGCSGRDCTGHGETATPSAVLVSAAAGKIGGSVVAAVAGILGVYLVM